MRRRSRQGRTWMKVIGVGSVLLAGCGAPTAPGVADDQTGSTVSTLSPTAPTSSFDEPVTTTGSTIEAMTSTTTDPTIDVSGWTETDVGSAVGDDFVSLTEHDGEVWLARLTEERDAYEVRDLAGDSVHRVAASPSSTPPLLFDTPFGLMLVTSDYERFLPTIRLSTDGGATWTEGSISSRPFDVSGVTAVAGSLLVPGAFRPVDEPGMGPFTPGMFRSDDGVTWTEVPLDPAVFDMTDSYLGPVIDLGDRLIMSGTRDEGDYRMPAMFESSDRGSTWQVSTDSGPAPSAVAMAGTTLVGVNSFLSPSDPAVPVSTNAGRAWEPVEVSRFAPPFQSASTFVLSGGPSALITFAVEPSTEYCYEHLDECQSGFVPTLLLVAADGTAVSVDLGAPFAYTSSGRVTADGSLHVVTTDGERLVIRSWDAANGPVPTVPDVEPFTPSGPPLAEWDARLEVGATYRFPLGTHCGIDVLGDFNGEHWWIVGSPEPAYDQYQSDMSQRLLGEITVVDADTIEYRVDGELIATYAPSAEEPPGCE